MSRIRKAAVAGHFYPEDPTQLKQELADFFSKVESKKKQNAFGMIAPHAGYIYSGQTASDVFSKIEIPSRVFILSPNHTGKGAPISMNTRGFWKTPLGDVKIDSDLADCFLKNFPLAKDEAEAHQEEHSLEVLLPFLQYLKRSFSFVPLTLQHLDYEVCEVLGWALAKSIRQTEEEVLIIASTDMNHYESQSITLQKDQVAIDAILQMDPETLYRQVHQQEVSMCGIIPTTIALVAAKTLGAQKAQLISHTTSGAVSGNYEQVVGYASFILS